MSAGGMHRLENSSIDYPIVVCEMFNDVVTDSTILEKVSLIVDEFTLVCGVHFVCQSVVNEIQRCLTMFKGFAKCVNGGQNIRSCSDKFKYYHLCSTVLRLCSMEV